MAKLELQGVRRAYPEAEVPALAGIDLSISSGEILVLVGPSGCGKSTVLRLIAGLDDPDAGTIRLDGRDLLPLAPQTRDVAMVFQGYALYPHMRVRDNIGFPLRMRGMAKADRAKKVAEAADLLGLGALLDRLPDELSGGERQRVAMGRALVREPKIFLFDEPLSNLDAALRTTLRVELARTLRELGATAIYVTHDQTEAMTVGHRVAVMRAGRIEQVGTPREIYEDPRTRFVASFLGTPRLNTIAVRASGGVVLAAGAEIEAPTEEELELELAFRPEHVSVRGSDEPASSTAVSFVANVGVTEPLGGETVLHCERPAEDGTRIQVRAKVPGFFDPGLSSEVRIEVPRDRLMWFDGATGARIDPKARR